MLDIKDVFFMNNLLNCQIHIRFKCTKWMTFFYCIHSANIPHTGTPACTSLDLVFVIDASGSLEEINHYWPIILNYLRTITERFPVSPGNVNIGAICYSNDAVIVWNLNEGVRKADVLSLIDTIDYKGGRTNIAAGLELAHTTMFSRELGDRDYAPNMILLVSDGVANERERDTQTQAAAARAKGIEIVTVGVGDNIDHVELIGIASRDEYFLTISNVDRLEEIVVDRAGSDPNCYEETPRGISISPPKPLIKMK